ncbi:hypothetical protein IQ07DRAFT_652819 [Pyrenochaeta sp. DS3sAY3a]|nr:hypothetical protein IQ07DRAFT_652819 [Pyrenochaeta sp. DS3sAY3a]
MYGPGQSSGSWLGQVARGLAGAMWSGGSSGAVSKRSHCSWGGRGAKGAAMLLWEPSLVRDVSSAHPLAATRRPAHRCSSAVGSANVPMARSSWPTAALTDAQRLGPHGQRGAASQSNAWPALCSPVPIYPRLDAAGERHGVTGTGNLSRQRPCLAGPRLAQLHLAAHLISQISCTMQCYAIQARQEQEMARCQNTRSVSRREIVFLGHHRWSPSFQSRAGPVVLPRCIVCRWPGELVSRGQPQPIVILSSSRACLLFDHRPRAFDNQPPQTSPCQQHHFFALQPMGQVSMHFRPLPA